MEKLIIALILCVVIIGPVLTYTSKDVVTFTVTEKERIVTRDNSYYLIFTEEGVYKNSDSFLYLKFNSSDVYGDIKVGETYTADVYWFRVPFLSMYKNIISLHGTN